MMNEQLKGEKDRGKYKGKPLLPHETYDKEAFDKQIKDLKSQVHQLFFENKTVLSQTNDFQKKQREKKNEFDLLCQEKNIEM